MSPSTQRCSSSGDRHGASAAAAPSRSPPLASATARRTADAGDERHHRARHSAPVSRAPGCATAAPTHSAKIASSSHTAGARTRASGRRDIVRDRAPRKTSGHLGARRGPTTPALAASRHPAISTASSAARADATCATPAALGGDQARARRRPHPAVPMITGPRQRCLCARSRSMRTIREPSDQRRAVCAPRAPRSSATRSDSEQRAGRAVYRSRWR